MNNIKIGFSAGNSLIPRIIRFFSKSKVSHSYIKYYDHCLGMDVVMESLWSGFEITPYDRFKKRTEVMYEFECKKDLSESVKWSASYLSRPYDWFSAAWLFLKIISKKIRFPFRSATKWHCTEAVARMLQYSGLAEELDAETLWPEDLLKYCKSNDNFIITYEKNTNSNR